MIRSLVPALSLGFLVLCSATPAKAADLRAPATVVFQRYVVFLNEYLVYISNYDGRTATAESVDSPDEFLLLGARRCEKVAAAATSLAYLEASFTDEEIAAMSGGLFTSGQVNPLRRVIYKDAKACHLL